MQSRLRCQPWCTTTGYRRAVSQLGANLRPFLPDKVYAKTIPPVTVPGFTTVYSSFVQSEQIPKQSVTSCVDSCYSFLLSLLRSQITTHSHVCNTGIRKEGLLHSVTTLKNCNTPQHIQTIKSSPSCCPSSGMHTHVCVHVDGKHPQDGCLASCRPLQWLHNNMRSGL